MVSNAKNYPNPGKKGMKTKDGWGGPGGRKYPQGRSLDVPNTVKLKKHEDGVGKAPPKDGGGGTEYRQNRSRRNYPK